MANAPKRPVATTPPVEGLIHVIRGQKVMLDADLAALYRVATGNLNLAVRRNEGRFPADFMFQLSRKEADSLLLQTATAKPGRGGGRHSVLHRERRTVLGLTAPTIIKPRCRNIRVP